MPTVQDVLKQSGFSDEDIAKLDAKAITGFTGVLTAADADRKAATEAAARAAELRTAAETAEKTARERAERAELVERSNKDFYEKNIVTALNGWDDERKKIEGERVKAVSEAAYYKTQAEGAKASGFIAADAPGFVYVPPTGTVVPEQQRDQSGRYVAGAPNGTPGSPTIMDDVRSALTDTTWAMQQYQQLHGGFLPDDPMQLAREADAMKLPYRAYVERKYQFAEKRQEIARKAQEDHDAAVRADVTKTYEEKLAAKDVEAKTNLDKARTEWAERTGNNPDVRTTVPSEMREVSRAVKQGERPDPLKLNNRERHSITRTQINERIAAQETAA
jgi:hypothetical protein